LIRLRYFEDMSLRDVAAVLGMSAATARRRELEALEELKRRFLAAAA
jgi:DNA-directed RNA polymerase specialized sigma subunit